MRALTKLLPFFPIITYRSILYIQSIPCMLVSIRTRPVGRAMHRSFEPLAHYPVFQSAPDQLVGRCVTETDWQASGQRVYLSGETPYTGEHQGMEKSLNEGGYQGFSLA